jgi:apolipoprotein D and lipocalin family protein
MLRFLILMMIVIATSGCTTGKPATVTPVSSFDLTQYLGQWYEIARLDHSFEQDLDQVTATYSLNSDGSVKVINRGFNRQKQQWQQAEGKAKFVDNKKTGYLKVSFFGPFYGSYIIFALSPDYSTALISSYNHEYLWLLSRNKKISPSELNNYLTLAEKAGFNTNQLIFPLQ